jgi:hypothetical protein
VGDCRTYTRDFLSKLALNVWSLDFDAMSLSDVVQDPEVRQHLIDAESALSKGDHKEAIKQAAAGLTKALDLVRSALVGSDTSPFVALVTEESRRIAGNDRVTRAFRRMQDTLFYLSLGIPYSLYISYQQLAGRIFIMADGKTVSQLGQKDAPDKVDAEFVVAFCTDTVVRVEAQVGMLSQPFGKEYWV